MTDLVVADLEKNLTTLFIPDGVGMDDWLSLTQSVNDLKEACTWFLVDTLLYGFTVFGEDFWQVTGIVGGLTEYTANRYLKIGASFPPDRRVEGLSVSHHEAVRALDPEVGDHILKEALKNGLNRDDVRALTRSEKHAQASKNRLEPGGIQTSNLSPEREAWRNLIRAGKWNGMNVTLPRDTLDTMGRALFGEAYRWETELLKEGSE